MTTKQPFTFQAIYRIEMNGEASWFIHLENGQIVVIREEEIRLYADKENLDAATPTTTISRKVETDAQAETGDEQPKRLL